MVDSVGWFWNLFDCCCCCNCRPKVYDYNKKYDVEIESLIDRDDKDYIESTKEISHQTSKKKPEQIIINVVNDGHSMDKMDKMEFYYNWKTKYWLDVDKIIEYENHFKISPYYLNDIKSIRKRQKLYSLIHSCFLRLPQSINENIYCLLSSNTLIDNMYKIYFQSIQKNKSKVNINDNDLGLIIVRSQLLKQYKLYKLYKSNKTNFWRYIGLNSQSSLHKVTLIIENDTEKEIFISWIGYNGKEETNSNIYPNTSTTIGTHTTNTFVIRSNDIYDDTSLIFNDLSIIAIYQIRHTFPTHIINISSLMKLRLKAGLPLKTIPIITKKYNKCIIENFKIYYQENVFNKYPKLMDILTKDLTKINLMINNDILNIMHSVSIWLNISSNIGHPNGKIKGYGLTFHHDPEWMKQNGIMLEKCRNIEIYSANDYMEWRICQPLILFHEFVHSFHCFIGRERNDIKRAYNLAMKNHLYDMVQHIARKDKITNQEIIIYRRGYAAMNHYEYFAQMTEAYFGSCNYYPFNKLQLKQYDNIAYQLCNKIWSFNAQQIANENIKYYQD